MNGAWWGLWYWLKFKIVLSSEEIFNYIQKIFFPHTFLRYSRLFSGAIKWRQFIQQKSLSYLDVIVLNNTDRFLTVR